MAVKKRRAKPLLACAEGERSSGKSEDNGGKRHPGIGREGEIEQLCVTVYRKGREVELLQMTRFAILCGF